MMRHELYPGLVCWLASPKNPRCLVRVVKVNPKNVRVIKEDGARWNVHPTFLSNASVAEQTSFKLIEPDEALVLGSVVRLKDAKARDKHPLLVIIRERASLFTLAPLGGDRGLHYSGISAAELEIVKFELNGV